MANISRIYTPANIFEGPADIYINIAAPTSSLVPTADLNTLVLDSSGQPTSATGFHAGLVEGPMMPTISQKLNEIHADQIESPIDAGFDAIEAEIDFVLKETNLSRLNTLINASELSAYTALAASQVWQMGGQFNSSKTPVTVLAIGQKRDLTSKWVYWMLYKAVLESVIPMSFQRSKETVYKLKFKGYADTTRVVGDELMQIASTKS